MSACPLFMKQGQPIPFTAGTLGSSTSIGQLLRQQRQWACVPCLKQQRALHNPDRLPVCRIRRQKQSTSCQSLTSYDALAAVGQLHLGLANSSIHRSSQHTPSFRTAPSLVARRHRRHRARAVAAATTHSTAPGQLQLISLEEVLAAARNRGLHVSVKTLGPFYRVTCREGSEDGKVLAVTSGFVAPLFRLMHCDTLQIFTKGLGGDDGQRIRGGPLGLGLLMGGATFAYGYSQGCKKAEILAINDDDAWHARLVKYYSYFGFKPVRVVEGDGLADIPHMLVWGGAGTRMDADIPAMLRKWTPSLRAAAAQLPVQQQAATAAAAATNVSPTEVTNV